MISPTDKQITKSMRCLKKLKDMMEVRGTKEQFVQFRKNLLERQKVANYQNE